MIYQNEIDKADMAYGDFKGLTKRTTSNKVLLDKAFNTAKIRSMMDINVGLLQWLITFLMKNLLVGVLNMIICQTGNDQKSHTNQLLETLRK